MPIRGAFVRTLAAEEEEEEEEEKGSVEYIGIYVCLYQNEERIANVILAAEGKRLTVIEMNWSWIQPIVAYQFDLQFYDVQAWMNFALRW